MSAADGVGRYARYKRATSEFLEWLSHAASHIPNISQSTGTIRDAAAAVIKESLEIPARIMASLETAIRLRKETHHSLLLKRSNIRIDESHSYFINLLCAIHRQFKTMMRAKEEPSTFLKNRSGEPSICLENPFERLHVGDEVDMVESESEQANDEEMSLDDFKEENVKFEVDVEPFMVMCFIMDVEEIMHQVITSWKEFKEQKITFMAATAVTNSALTLITKLSSTLQLDYPHLVDFDSLLTVLYMDDVVDFVLQCSPNLPYATAIDIVTKARYCTLERLIKPTVKYIRKKANISSKYIIDQIISLSVQSHLDQVNLMFIGSPYIGGLNSITNTHTMLTKMFEAMNENVYLIAKPGIFGAKWDEKKRLAIGTSDLCDFLMADVLPPLLIVSSGNHPTLGENQSEIFSLLPMVRDYQTNKVVSIPFTFAMHTLLSVVVSTQGQMFISRVAADSVVKMANLQKRIEHDMEINFIDTPVSKKNLLYLHTWINVMNNASYRIVLEPKQRMRALFNPWMAGQHLALMALEVGIHAGLSAVDSIAQARMVLHLYNAFLILGIINHMPLLDQLIDAYSKSDALFVGGRPVQKGQFLKGFLLAWGYETRSAVKMAAALNSDVSTMSLFRHDFYRNAQGRNLQAAEPEDFLHTYRLMALKDFSRLPPDSFANCTTLLKAVKRTVQSERHLLGINLNTLGKTFLKVWNGLLQELELDTVVKEHVSKLRMEHKEVLDKKKGSGWRDSEENELIFFQTSHLWKLFVFCDQENPTSTQLAFLAKAANVISSIVSQLTEKEYYIFKE
ncbi:hypothetical protein GOP47_0022034 [Adiantum capillus-veneris]|uniref:DUF6604 domain-containing protein n=1 Tax=Adiantum capillus-veneris TaxID=13818 RepID=A0A9D4Z7G8_ADICA|nr:hypothetical protein GOP47_0022034 [Adiantum capillus-veneris]